MSRNPNGEMQILLNGKFNEYCAVLGVKEMCCLEPERKTLEKAFRKKALKCHPDKGGDPIEFKKLNDAFNKLLGHIEKLEQQAEAIELANSVLIEISKTSVKNWQSKLQTRYGWFKGDNCKNIIFDGPYKQYMGRSKNTGNITVVLYEDPPDGIPKMHIRSTKYMAWIAEQQMPVHMHVEKGRQLAFEQWRIVHMAEFGVYTFSGQAPPTPKNEPKIPKPPKTPKAKRRQEREEAEATKAKARRDSEPSPERGTTENKENAQGGMRTDWKNCVQCGAVFSNLMDAALHKQTCVPGEGKKEDTKGPSKPQNSNGPKFECSQCGEKFTNMIWYAKHQGNCSYDIHIPEDEYEMNMKYKAEQAKKSNPSSQAQHTKPNEHIPETKEKTEPQPKVPEKPKESTPTKSPEKPKEPEKPKVAEIPKVAEKPKEPIVTKVPHESKDSEKTKVTEVPKVVEKTKDPVIPKNPEKSKEPTKPKEPPVEKSKNKGTENLSETVKKVPLSTTNNSDMSSEKPRRFSAVIPDEPPQKFIDSPPKDIPNGNCDNKKNVNGTHSKPEEHINGVTRNGNKTQGGNVAQKTSETTNGSSVGEPNLQEKREEVKMRKPGALGTKNDQVTKPSKPEGEKNDPRKTSNDKMTPKNSVEAMEVDDNSLLASKPAMKKSDMPMGSLLKDLPANTPQMSTAELGQSGGKSQAPARVKFSTNHTTHHLPAGLDTEALKLTRNILASTTNDQEEEVEEVAVTTSSKSLKPGVSLVHNRAGGSPCVLDREAIRLTDTFLHQGEEEADTTTTNTPTTSPPAILTAPGKSILKKPVETVEPVFEAKKMVSQETSEYHLAERVSQYDACPHKEEVTKSPTTHIPGKSELGKSASVTSKKPDASKSLAAASSKTAFTTTPNIEVSKPAIYSRQTSEVTVSSYVATQKTELSKPTATPKAFSPQPTSFHPPQPAALGRVAPATTKTSAPTKLEVKHANQKIMVNSPLSPTILRKEVPPQQDETTPATISPLTGRPLATDSQAGPSYGSNLKSQLESLDSQYKDNLKKTNIIREEQAKKHQESLKPLPAVYSSPAPVSQVKSAVATSLARSQAVTTNKLPQETSPTPAPSVLKNVTADLKKMDDVHSAHMKKIEDNFKEQDMRSKQPPTTDHHSSRPPTLGRSRFESPNTANRFSTSVTADSLRIDPVLRNTPAVLPMEQYVPRRNETVHDMTSFTSSKSPDPNPIARSATTTMDTSYKSPEVSRRKFERNFNASPEPFPTSKSSSNVRFSDPPVSSVKPASPSKPPKIPATSASSTYSERTTSRPSYTERPYSPPKQTYTPPSYSTSSSSYSSTPSYVPSTSYFTSAPLSTISYSTSNPYSSSSATSYSSPSTYSYSPKSTSFPSPSEHVTPTISSSPSYFSSSSASTTYSTTLDRTRSDTTLSMSRSAGDLQAKIQATKDQHKTSIKNAMNFDRTVLKPPIIAQKLPRPEPSKYSVSGSSMSNTLEKREGREIRRMERERAVMEKVLGERSSRGKSDDLLTATRPSYRL